LLALFRRSLRHSPHPSAKIAPRGAIVWTAVLLRFFVVGVLAATPAKLRELQPTGGRLLVLRRRVVPLLAHRTLQCHDFAHPFILTETWLLFYSREPRFGFQALFVLYLPASLSKHLRDLTE
jgi:hypothetical protein